MEDLLPRTERVLIKIALVLLVLTAGSWSIYDYLYSTKTLEVTSLSHAQSVFVGSESRAQLRVGRSEMTFNQNTLATVSKSRQLNRLNLTYGSVQSTLAQGDRLLISNSAGEEFELKAVEVSKIDVYRYQGKIVLQVLEGNAQLIYGGHVQSLVSRDLIQLSNFAKITVNPLIFTAPKFSAHYASDVREEVEFSWQYTRSQEAGPFVFEVSDSSSFKTLLLREEVREAQIKIPLPCPAVIYYRVKDEQGNHSEIRRLNLLAPQAPTIALKSKANSTIHLMLSALTQESKATVQIASDPEFRQILTTRKGVASNYGFQLPAGKYFARARLEYRQFNRDLTSMVSPWSATSAFSVR